jgi:hypothetical protein
MAAFSNQIVVFPGQSMNQLMVLDISDIWVLEWCRIYRLLRHAVVEWRMEIRRGIQTGIQRRALHIQRTSMT